MGIIIVLAMPGRSVIHAVSAMSVRRPEPESIHSGHRHPITIIEEQILGGVVRLAVNRDMWAIVFVRPDDGPEARRGLQLFARDWEFDA